MRNVWGETLRTLEQRLPARDYATWIAPIRPAGIEHGAATLEVPNGFFRDWVRQYFLGQLTEALSNASGEQCRIALVVNPEVALPAPAAPPPAPRVERAAVRQQRVIGRLVPEYTLDAFIIGVPNELAAQAALAVSVSPGRCYNPLFLHGGVGVGKTHLLNAVGHAVLAQHAGKRIACLTAEAFVNAMITALRSDRMDAFRARFRRIDVLIIDDVQFLGGKVRSQEEFFHTFDTLRDGQRQIVLASDRPPQEIRGLEAGLRSRFTGGLLTPMGVPDEPLRARIVAAKAATVDLEISLDMCAVIAASADGNVRQIQGLLNTLRARATLSGEPVSRTLVREVLGTLGVGTSARGPEMATILRATAEAFDVSLEHLTSARRTARLVEARQVAMLLGRELTELPLAMIGRQVGGRDHSTVVYGLARVRKRLAGDSKLREVYEGLRLRISAT
jgi:chromosomal replication initiator protein